MKKWILALLLLSGLAQADSPFFWGAHKSAEMFPALNTISFGNQSLFIESGALDPSAVATYGPPGSLYLSTLGNAYVKADAGVTNNWVLLGAGSGGITALSGDVTTVGTSGTAAATVATVGTSTAANVHTAEAAVNAHTWAATGSTVPWRDSFGSTQLSYLVLPWRSTPACLHTNTGLLYTKNDGFLYYQDENCVESVIGGQSSPGTVTQVSVATANGFDGTVTNATTTPDITLTTTVSGVLKGSAGALTAATSGTDFAPGTSANTTGIVKSTTGTGALTTAVAADFPTLNQNTTGTAATATVATSVTTTATNATNATFFPTFVASSTSGNQGTDTATGLTFNPSTGALTATTFAGNASTATALAATPTGCTNQFGVTIASSGNLGCASVADAYISAGAAIARSKLATGSNNHVLINDGSGVMSSEANLAISRGGTGAGTKTAAFDALSPNTAKGDVTVHNGTNNVRQAVGSFGQVLTADSSQTTGLKWSTPSKGTKNYITTNADIEQNSTTGFSLGTATLTNGLLSGAPTFGSGASGNLSIAATATSPIADTYSLNYVSSAATTAGNFVATDPFTVDPEGQAKSLQFKISYQYVSGTLTSGSFSGTSSNYFGVALYDVTNSAWIPCSGAFNVVQISGVGIATGTCQTNITTASARLAFYNVSASSGAITMKLDNWSYGPQVSSSGPSRSDMQSYSMSITGSVSNPSLGTVAVNNAQYALDADGIIINYQLKTSSAGSIGSGTYLFSLPSGMTIDTAKITPDVNDAYVCVGSASGSDNGGTPYRFTGCPYVYDSTHLAMSVIYTNGSTTGSGLIGSGAIALNGSNGASYSFVARVPIVGKSSNTVQSADSDQRIVAMQTSGTPSASLSSSAAVVKFSSTAKDTHGQYSTSTGLYTVPISGFYRVTAGVGVNGTGASSLNNADIHIRQNGSDVSLNTYFYIASQTNLYMTSAVTVYCAAGDTLGPYADTQVGSPTVVNNAGTYFNIEKLSGSAVVQATDGISFRYHNASGPGSVTTTPTVITFNNKDWDDRASYSASTGLFTAPAPGKYHFDSKVVGYDNTVGDIVTMSLYKNGVSYATHTITMPSTGSSSTQSFTMNDEVSLLPGDTVGIYFQTGGNTFSFPGSNTSVYFSGVRVSN